MTTIFYMLIFFLWATFWSFWWVIIERGKWWFDRSEWSKIFWGRSFCPWCDWKTLTWWQLVPLLGWLFQWGKCYRCKNAIPGWYQLIELLMWLVFVLVTYLIIWPDWVMTFVPMLPHLIFWLLATWLLVLIIIADVFYYELNMYAWMILIVIQLLYLWFLWVDALVTGVLWSVVLWCVFMFIYRAAKRYATKKFGVEAEWIGLWDVFMAFSIGLFAPLLMQMIPWIDTVVTVQMVFLYLVWSSALWIIYYAIRMVCTSDEDEDDEKTDDHPAWSAMMPFLPAMIVMFWVLLLWWANIVGWMGM